MNKRQSSFACWCVVCGNAFRGGSARAIYCSDACKQAAYRVRKGQEKAPKRYGKGVNKSAAGRTVKHKAVTCPHCDKRFIPKRKDTKFCSASCRVVANRNKQARTIRKLVRLNEYTDYGVLMLAQEHGWSAAYRVLERLGYTYHDRDEMWKSEVEALAQGALPL